MGEALAFDEAEVRATGRTILGPITLRIDAGERWAVLGPNGSGKTTMLRLAGAMRQPSAGRVRILDATVGRADLRALRPRIAHVGHAVSDAVPPSLSVLDVVLSGTRGALVPWLAVFDDAEHDRAWSVLERFGCDDLAARSIASCSQGERQRVLLARALVGRPDLLLLDEPAAGLDLPAREALIGALEDAVDLGATPSILVTHHVEEIPATTTHAALLRGGRLTAVGPVEEVVGDGPMSDAFGMPLRVGRDAGRWHASARR